MAWNLGLLGAASLKKPPYRIQTFGGSGAELSRTLAIDSNQNLYLLGSTASAGSGGRDLLLIKCNFFGAIQWQRALGGSNNEDGTSVAITPTDDVYVLGNTTSTPGTLTDILVARYDSSGAMQWQRRIGRDGSGTDDYGTSIAIDSIGNPYVAGATNSVGFGSFDFYFAKLNTSGAIQSQRTVGRPAYDYCSAMAISSTDEVYLLGDSDWNSAGGTDFLLVKLNSSGSIQWQRRLGGNSADVGLGLAVDSLGNVYAAGRSNSSGTFGADDAILLKYNSSGAIQWQRRLGGSGADSFRATAVDSQDNVYAIGTTSAGAGANDILIAKYNSSGTLQWQRVLGGTSAEEGRSILIDSSDNLYVLGTSSSAGAGNSDLLLAVLPSDGSLTGTYVVNGANITYAASSLSSATSTLSEGAASVATDTYSLSAFTTSFASSAISLTSYETAI